MNDNLALALTSTVPDKFGESTLYRSDFLSDKSLPENYRFTYTLCSCHNLPVWFSIRSPISARSAMTRKVLNESGSMARKNRLPCCGNRVIQVK
jgi:hypothetical protein